MTREEKSKWLDQLENSLTRAEQGKKDLDLIVLLRWAYKKALEELKQEERIDPVKHGKWVDHIRDYWCSECGGRIQKEQAKRISRCPYCGARMDL